MMILRMRSVALSAVGGAEAAPRWAAGTCWCRTGAVNAHSGWGENPKYLSFDRASVAL